MNAIHGDGTMAAQFTLGADRAQLFDAAGRSFDPVTRMWQAPDRPLATPSEAWFDAIAAARHTRMSADTIRPEEPVAGEEPAAGGFRHTGSASRHSWVWRAGTMGALSGVWRQRDNIRSVAAASATISFDPRCVCARRTPLIDHPERSAERQN